VVALLGEEPRRLPG